MSAATRPKKRRAMTRDLNSSACGFMSDEEANSDATKLRIAKMRHHPH
jgi:hypothetical protein